MEERVDAPPASSGDVQSLRSIDLSRYRSRELTAQFVELLGVPDALMRILRTTLVLVLAVSLVFIGPYWADGLPWYGWFVLAAYSLAVGIAVGGLLGFIRVIGKALLNIEGILQVTVEIAEVAIEDTARLRSGMSKLPTAREILEHTYDEVIFPTMAEVVSGTFGVLGKPMLWVYRVSVGAAIGRLIKRTHADALTEDDVREIVDGAADEIEAFSEYTEKMKAYMRRASDIVGATGRAMRIYALRPLYAVFVLALAASAVPVLIVRMLMN